MQDKPDAIQWDSLSERERQVLALASTGQSDKEIAARMGISVNTLRTFWARIRRKLGDLPRTGLVAAYVEANAPNRSHVHTETEFEWVIDLDRWLIQAISGLVVSLYGTDPIPLDLVLQEVFGDQHSRIRSLLDAVQKGYLKSFHVTANSANRDRSALTTAYCVVEYDSNQRPIRVWGKRVPSVDFRRPARGNSLAGRFGFAGQPETFWADRDARDILGIDASEADAYSALLAQIEPEDRPKFLEAVKAALDDSVSVTDFGLRLSAPDLGIFWVLLDMIVIAEPSSERQVRGIVKSFV